MLIQADAAHIPLADESVQMICTSPPYWGLRDYQVAGQLGLEPTPELYVEHIVAVFREVRRVLREDGTVFLNLGDSYFGSNQGRMADGSQVGGKKQMTNKGSVTIGGGVQRVTAYGTSDKVPASLIDRDCLCGSLCGECRRAYQIGKSHSGYSHVPTLEPLPFATNHEHTELPSDHLPTLDSSNLAVRNQASMLDPEQTQDRVNELPRASQETTSGESFQQRGESRLLASNRDGECLLCARPLNDYVQQSVHTSGDSSTPYGSNGGIELHDGRLDPDNQNTDRVCAYCKEISFSLDDIKPQSTINLKPKDLVGIPWRVAFALQADGWYLRSDIIWSKPNPMPESVTDRPTKAHEYLFLLAKSEKYFYDAEAIKEPTIWAQDPRAGLGHIDYDGKRDGTKGSGQRAFVSIDPSGRNCRTVWTIATQSFPDAHFATFPEDLVTPCILAGTSHKGCCPECGAPWVRVVEKERTKDPTRHTGRAAVGCNDRMDADEPRMLTESRTVGWEPGCECKHKATVACRVLDPFSGSGTVVKVAQDLGRVGIGLDLKPEYLKMGQKRISQLGFGAIAN